MTREERRSLDELEGSWGPAPADAANLMRRCHKLHATPLSDLTPDQLRLALSQQIGLQWIVPLALDALEREPMVEGDNYPGDVLAAAVRLPVEALHGVCARLCAIVQAALANGDPEWVPQAAIADLKDFRRFHCDD